jgi:hypothetical protein
MFRVRRTPHGKTQLDLYLSVATSSDQCHGEVAHGRIRSRTSGTVHANRKTNGNVTTPKACNLLYCEQGMEVREKNNLSNSDASLFRDATCRINTATADNGNEE